MDITDGVSEDSPLTEYEPPACASSLQNDSDYFSRAWTTASTAARLMEHEKERLTPLRRSNASLAGLLYPNTEPGHNVPLYYLDSEDWNATYVRPFQAMDSLDLLRTDPRCFAALLCRDGDGLEHAALYVRDPALSSPLVVLPGGSQEQVLTETFLSIGEEAYREHVWLHFETATDADGVPHPAPLFLLTPEADRLGAVAGSEPGAASEAGEYATMIGALALRAYRRLQAKVSVPASRSLGALLALALSPNEARTGVLLAVLEDEEHGTRANYFAQTVGDFSSSAFAALLTDGESDAIALYLVTAPDERTGDKGTIYLCSSTREKRAGMRLLNAGARAWCGYQDTEWSPEPEAQKVLVEEALERLHERDLHLSFWD